MERKARKEVYLKLKGVSRLSPEKVKLRLDAIVLQGDKTLPYEKVVLDLEGQQTEITTAETGKLEDIEIVVNLQEAVRAELRTCIKGERFQRGIKDILTPDFELELDSKIRKEYKDIIVPLSNG